MFPYAQCFETFLSKIRSEGRYRDFVYLERSSENPPYARYNDQDVCVFCSNDYLGMSYHPHVIQSFKESSDRFGVGSGGTRNIAGSAFVHRDLERLMATLHQKESALLFSSGYAANEGALQALGSILPKCIFFSDEKNHASIVEGIRHSRCARHVFRHNDIEDLRRLLSETEHQCPKIIACVSLYSMDGDIAPLNAYCDLADAFGALLYVDEVHAVGIYGERGGGISEHLGLTHRIPIIQGNFAKAYGVVGGYIAGNAICIDAIRSSSKGFIFTTSLPPAVACAAHTSVSLLMNHRDVSQKLLENTSYFKSLLKKTSLSFGDSQTHIIPIFVNDPFLCRELSERLLQEFGFYVQPINYPTVPRGCERLRVTLSPHHTKEMIQAFVSALDHLWVETTKDLK